MSDAPRSETAPSVAALIKAAERRGSAALIHAAQQPSMSAQTRAVPLPLTKAIGREPATRPTTTSHQTGSVLSPEASFARRGSHRRLALLAAAIPKPAPQPPPT
eukprot:scaffold84322_cov63-Phaeocystis_antarctica.AAC.6